MSQIPLYCRLLRLQHLRPNSWQRALFADAPLAVAAILVLADVASAWTLLALPLAVTAVVKAHDALTGLLHPAACSEARGVEVRACDSASGRAGAGSQLERVADARAPLARPEQG